MALRAFGVRRFSKHEVYESQRKGDGSCRVYEMELVLKRIFELKCNYDQTAIL
jgi:hypothetical protein